MQDGGVWRQALRYFRGLVLGGLSTLSATAAVLIPQPLLDPTVATNYSNVQSTTSNYFIAMGGHTYFLTGDTLGGTNNGKLWVTDGGAATLVKDLGAVTGFSAPVTNGSKLYFVVNTTGGTNGSSFLWQSDGTTSGTTTVSGVGGQINTGVANSSPLQLCIIGSDLYFGADTLGGPANSNINFQIYKYTGSGSAAAVTSYNTYSAGFAQNIAAINGVLFYTQASSATNLDVFRYNPANGNVTQITSFGGTSGANASKLTVFGTTLFFIASDNSQLHNGNPERHWFKVESDGTGLTNLTPNGYNNGSNSAIAKVGSNYYFGLNDSVAANVYGNQIFKSDGTTTKGATLYTDQDGTHNAGFVRTFVALGSKLLVVGEFKGSTGNEPGIIDTADSTGTVTLLKDINVGSGNGLSTSTNQYFGVVGGTAFFNATTTAGFLKIFQTDGTSAGTVETADLIDPGSTDFPNRVDAVGNFIYFRAQTSNTSISPGTNPTQRLPFNFVNVALGAGSGQTVAVNSAAATALQVNVKDTANIGNVSGVAVTFAPPGSGASGSFSSSATVITDANGNAAAPTFTANGTQGSYSVKVLLSGFDTGLTFSLTNGPASAAPTVTTNAATSVTPTGAVLNGSVNANGASTAVTFNYGPTNTYGFSITAAQSPVTGSSATPVSAALSGLVPGATYHYQAVGVNSGGTTPGADQTFTVGTGVDYDFETIASSTISFSSSGKTWGLTGQFTGVTVGGGAPAAGTRTPESGAYIDTGYGRAMSLGNVGGIQAPPGYTFRAASFDILPSDAAGNNGQYTIGNTTQANAVLTGVGATYQLIGKKGGTQVCSATVADTARTPADSDTSNQGGFWHHIDLTGTAFATTDIDDIEFVLIAQTNVNDPVTYIALDNFTYSSLTALPPTVTSLGTSTGPTAGGTSVVITGTNFTGATAVKFGANNATGYTVNSATQITATAPAGTSTVDVTVTTPGGTSATSAADQFTYVPAPTVASISSTIANGSYKATTLIPITVTFSAAVTVTGTPTLALNSGGSASYASGSGTSTLTFNYTVGATDNATLLDCSSTTALVLAGGTINATTGGTAANLTLPTPGGANSLGVNKAIVIDTTAPTIVSINRQAPTGQTTPSNVVTFRVTYSEAVTVPGINNFAVVAVNGSTIVGTVTSVTGSGTTRDVVVTITSGTGEFRLRGVN